jgi:CRP-like cAMP-binding protein
VTVSIGGTTSPAVTGNQLLSHLPATVLERLQPHLQMVTLRQKQVLFRAHEPIESAYFPSTAVASVVATLESGQSLEVGLVGRDGLAGAAGVPDVMTMPCDGVVQIGGDAQRIDAEVLNRELLASETLNVTIRRFAHLLLVRSMQMSACCKFHSVEQRCARWLITVGDVIDTPDIPLTHDLLATTLGAHRPTVSFALGALSKAGLISERRGVIVLRDRHGLSRTSCECYRLLRAEQRRLLGY